MKLSNEILGGLAAIVTSLAFLEIKIKLYKEKTSSSLTHLTLLMNILGQILWLIYGFRIKNPIIIGSGIVSLIIYLLLMLTKYIF